MAIKGKYIAGMSFFLCSLLNANTSDSDFYKYTNYNPDLPESSIKLEDFANPKGKARVQTWWHWINANVSREGIAKDLKAMADCNYGAAIIFNVSSGETPEGPLKFNSPEWFENFRYVLDEAKKHNIEIGLHNCDGWSEAGGPWITPELSMKRLTKSKVRVNGNGTLKRIKMPQPYAGNDWFKKDSKPFYKDIAVIAYPAFRPQKVEMEDYVKKIYPASEDNSKNFPKRIKSLFDGNLGSIFAINPSSEKYKMFGMDVEFAKPYEASAVYINTRWSWRNPDGVFVAVSDDGKNYREVCSLDFKTNECYQTFPSQKAKYWRIGKRVGKLGIDAFQMKLHIAELELVPSGSLPKNAPFISALLQKVGYTKCNISRLPYDNLPVPKNAIIDPKKIKFLDMSEDGTIEWTFPKGKWEVLRIGYTTNGVGVHPASPSGKGLESDKLSAKATDFHFDSYLAKMIDVAGKDAGKTFKYVETDSWECGSQNWTEGMEKLFQEFNGYNLLPWLPVLLGEVVHSKEATEKFAADYRALMSHLVVKNFYGRLGERVRERGLMYQTEPLSEGSLRDQLGLYKMADVPQHELWQLYRDLNKIEVPKSTGHGNVHSVVSFFGKAMGTCESLTQNQGNWADSPLVLKGKIDTIFLAGMNTIVFHSYTHQPDDRVPGWAMEPWGSTINRKMPWFEIGREFFNYIGRSQYMLQQGKSVVNGLALQSDEVPVVGEPNHIGAGYDTIRINPDCLRNYLRVENGKLVSPGRIKYDYIEIPNPTYEYKASTLKALKKLVEQGAVLCSWKLTTHRSGVAGDEAEWQKLNDELFGDGKRQVRKIGKGKVYVEYHPKEMPRVLGLKPTCKISGHNIAVRTRQHEDGSLWYYVVNCTSAEKNFDISFKVVGKQPEIWNPETGKSEKIGVSYEKDGYTTIPMRLAQNDSMFVVFRESKTPLTIVESVVDGKKLFPNFKGVKSELSRHPNIDLKGNVSMEFFGKGKVIAKLSDGTSKEISCDKVRGAVEFETPFKLSFQEKFDAPKSTMLDKFISWTEHSDVRIKNYSGVGTYELKANVPKLKKDERAYLCFGKIMELGRIKVNGKLAGTLWKAPYVLEITKFLKVGENKIEVEVGNTWVNRCLYDATLPPEKRITWANTMQYHFPIKNTKPLLNQGMDRSWKQGLIPSGIIGDSKIIFSKIIKK